MALDTTAISTIETSLATLVAVLVHRTKSIQFKFSAWIQLAIILFPVQVIIYTDIRFLLNIVVTLTVVDITYQIIMRINVYDTFCIGAFILTNATAELTDEDIDSPLVSYLLAKVRTVVGITDDG